ncbi:LysM peptidoglycan-binding domain-containing protein [Paenibacillus sp. NPDC058071]|uniref:LysM peptidoglycan-binding domain-containing protein n=1 Tax=Paenibacillus sp. NPDC058071 TaxID=3346326 RepID=UPI0036DCCD52
MSEQTKGLRFDVYERIHLPDEVAAIEELEEIELVPRIQVIEQDDHAVLKGQLLLTGVYRGQTDNSLLQTLEHWIPVEITLPLNRISRLDDISVEIDNFDVDLLSSRTLNITGVLSLQGILVEPLPEAEEAWREEPITAVHERENNGYGDEAVLAADSFPYAQPFAPQPYFFGQAGQIARADENNADEEEGLEAYEAEESAEEEEATVTISASPRDSGWSAAQWFEPPPAEQQPFIQQDAREFAYSSPISAEEAWQPHSQEQEVSEPAPAPFAFASPPEFSGWQEPQSSREDEVVQPAAEAIPEVIPAAIPEAEPEKPELRIGLGAKPAGQDPDPAPGVGLLTLLQTSKREQAARHAAEQEAAQQAVEQTKSRSSGDEIEWKSLFLGKQADEQEFRKIRLCIVQRDETLESIAVRYSLNPREILLYNGLNESAVAEGQLLYIP